MSSVFSSIFGGGKMPEPSTDNSAQVAAAEAAERKRAASAQGRRSTILTSGSGVADNIGTKTKLGA